MLNSIPAINGDIALKDITISLDDLTISDIKKLLSFGLSLDFEQETTHLIFDERTFAKLVNAELEMIDEDDVLYWFCTLYFPNQRKKLEGIEIYFDLKKTLNQIIDEIRDDWTLNESDLEDLKQLKEMDFINDPKNVIPR